MYYNIIQCQCFFYRQRIIRINVYFCVMVWKNIWDTTFLTYKISNLILITITFFKVNQYWISSLIINSNKPIYFITNVIRNGFRPMKVFFVIIFFYFFQIYLQINSKIKRKKHKITYSYVQIIFNNIFFKTYKFARYHRWNFLNYRINRSEKG